ncbi:MAG: halocyanin domain-containing protein [Halobacteriaceae archaeon]
MTSDRSPAPTVTRRRFLTATGTATAGLAVGPTSAAAAPSFDGWFDNVGNYSGVVDKRGTAEVTVEVGVPQGGLPFGFGPPAIQVDSGTTVSWKWTGDGGSHNVVDLDGAFQSDLYSEPGTHFSHTFESTGVSKYYCSPHRANGMKGAVIVGSLPDTAAGGGGSSLADLGTLALGGLLGVGLVLLPIAASRRSAE